MSHIDKMADLLLELTSYLIECSKHTNIYLALWNYWDYFSVKEPTYVQLLLQFSYMLRRPWNKKNAQEAFTSSHFIWMINSVSQTVVWTFPLHIKSLCSSISNYEFYRDVDVLEYICSVSCVDTDIAMEPLWQIVIMNKYFVNATYSSSNF